PHAGGHPPTARSVHRASARASAASATRRCPVRLPFTRSQLLAGSATVLVLAWAGVALALSAAATADKANNPRSADPAQTPETCNKSGCHTTLPAAGCSGGVELLGLPGCYVAGQTYRLTVKITDANARR